LILLRERLEELRR
jgi:hypothetical protein